MSFLYEFLFALVVGLILTTIFSVLVNKTRRWRTILMFFVILFLATWAGGIWIKPFGPALLGIYWLPFVVVGLIFALILTMLLPNRPPKTSKEAETKAESMVIADKLFKFFIWLLFIVLVASIIVAYVSPDQVVL